VRANGSRGTVSQSPEILINVCLSWRINLSALFEHDVFIVELLIPLGRFFKFLLKCLQMLSFFAVTKKLILPIKEDAFLDVNATFFVALEKPKLVSLAIFYSIISLVI